MKKKILALEAWKFDIEYSKAYSTTPLTVERAFPFWRNATIDEEIELEEKNHADKTAKSEVLKWHTWTLDGKQVKAKYSGISSGVMKLKKEDGTLVKVKVSDLAKEDRKWLDSKPWAKP